MGAKMSRPGTVITLEKTSPPMMFNAGDGFHYEKLPEGTRVIYPPEPLEPLADPYVAIERALLMPFDMEPLHDLLFPDRLYNYDAEDEKNHVVIGTTDHGEEVRINRRAAESDLLVYVNINLVAMDGGHKSTATGLASYRSLRHHHNVRTMQHSRSFMDQHRSELHSSNWRMGRHIAAQGVKVFQIESTLNTNTFPSQFSFLQRREWEWSARDRAGFIAVSTSLDRTPSR